MVHCVHDWTVRGIDDYLAKALLGFNDFSSCLAKNDVLFVSLWIQRYESTHQHPKWETYYSLTTILLHASFKSRQHYLKKKKKNTQNCFKYPEKNYSRTGSFQRHGMVLQMRAPTFFMGKIMKRCFFLICLKSRQFSCNSFEAVGPVLLTFTSIGLATLRTFQSNLQKLEKKSCQINLKLSGLCT